MDPPHQHREQQIRLWS